MQAVVYILMLAMLKHLFASSHNRDALAIAVQQGKGAFAATASGGMFGGLPHCSAADTAKTNSFGHSMGRSLVW